MPRKPLGEQAMTDAERQRKRRERLRQERGPTDPSPAAVIDALRKENARLRRLAETTTEARREDPAAPSSELVEARKEIERLRAEADALRTQAQTARQQGWQDATNAFHKVRDEQRAETEARKAKQATARAAAQAADAAMSVEDKATLLEKLEQCEKLLKARNTQIRNLKEKVAYFADKNPKMDKRLHRQVLGFLHPDRAHNDEATRRRMEKVFQSFSAIKFRFPPEDAAQ